MPAGNDRSGVIQIPKGKKSEGKSGDDAKEVKQNSRIFWHNSRLQAIKENWSKNKEIAK